ncbi:hypothetical protein F2982_23095 (plasmid) [Rhizobium sp. BG4]|nr:hypothetical protein F2982_23095 [Rhizobium sp. BG4]
MGRGMSGRPLPAIRAIKKAPPGACLPRMGAFAGWLRHPAHAPYHHYENRRDHNALELPANFGPVNRVRK